MTHLIRSRTLLFIGIAILFFWGIGLCFTYARHHSLLSDRSDSFASSS